MVSGIRLSASDPLRPLLLLLVVAGVRLALDRQRPFLLSRRADWRRRWSRVYRPDADPSGTSVIPWRASAAGALGICAVAWSCFFRSCGRWSSARLRRSLLSTWRMGWVYEQLRGDPRRLFDANIFNPEPLTFTYSDSMLLPGATAAPRWPPACGRSWPTTSCSCPASCSVRPRGAHPRRTPDRIGRRGVRVGLVFGFYPYHFEHYSHLELQMMQWMPLALLAIHRFLATAARAHARGCRAVCRRAAVFVDVLRRVFRAVRDRRDRSPADPVRPRVATHASPRLPSPPSSASRWRCQSCVPIRRPPDKGSAENEVQIFSAEPADYLARTLEARSTAHAAGPAAGAGALPRPRADRARGRRPGAAARSHPPRLQAGLLLAFDGSLGFNGLTYPCCLRLVVADTGPAGAGAFQCPGCVSLAVLGGFGVQRLLAARATATASRAMFAATVIAAVVNVWPELPLRAVWPEPPPMYGALAGAPHVVLAEFPVPVTTTASTPATCTSRSGTGGRWSTATAASCPTATSSSSSDVIDFPDPASIAALKGTA